MSIQMETRKGESGLDMTDWVISVIASPKGSWSNILRNATTTLLLPEGTGKLASDSENDAAIMKLA